MNSIPNSEPTIYLAGKISKNDWRKNRGVLNDDGSGHYPDWDTLYDTIEGFRITGPFFLCCDHGCAHGRGAHAVAGGCGNDDIGSARTWAHKQCTKAIARADVFFAWLDDDLTAYGTLVEIGQAYSLNKYIVIGVPSNTENPWSDYQRGTIERFHNPTMDNLWYAASCATDIIQAPHPDAAIAQISKEAVRYTIEFRALARTLEP